MNNKEVVKELKDLLVKLEGSINILRRCPEIVVYNKLFGASQNIQAFTEKLEKEEKDINASD